MVSGERRASSLRAARSFAPLFVRAIRACRLYPAGNHVRQSHLEGARTALGELLADMGSLTFGIREGALLFGDEVVFVDDDQRTGLTHLLASHAIFELTFQPGLTEAEVERLVLVLAEDRDHRRRRGEDMVTLLWRHHFTHARYRHVDVLVMATPADAPHGQLRVEDEETVRLRGELAEVVRALAVDEATGDDLITLSDRSLDTPEASQRAIDGHRRRVDWAIAAFAHRTPQRTMEALSLELAASRGHEALVVRLAGAVLDSLMRHPRPTDEGSGLALVWRTLADLLSLGALDGVRYLVERAVAMASRPLRREDAELAEALLARLIASDVMDRAVELLDHGTDPRDASRAAALLRAMGARALDGLMARLDRLERPHARDVACTIAVEASAQRTEALAAAVTGLRAEAAAQLLRAAQVLPPAALARLGLAGLTHGQGMVRAIAARIIAGFEGPTPEALLVRALGDTDAHVRTVAARVVTVQRIEAAARTIAGMLQRPGALERDPVELRALFHAHATLSGSAAVDELGRLLAQAAALTGGHKGATIEAAATALAATGSSVALEVLTRGAHSLNPRLRGPCKTALANAVRTSSPPEEPRVARVRWPEALERDALAGSRTGGPPLRPSAPPPRPSAAPPRPSAAPAGPLRPSVGPPPPSASPARPLRPSAAPHRPEIAPHGTASTTGASRHTIDDSLREFLSDDEDAS